MGRQNRQVQRRLGAVAGKGMTDALQISPTTRSKARSTAFIRSSSSRPKGLLIFERGRVESLSTITCESTRNPLALSGSTVMRKAASRTALVIGQITRLSSSAKRFDRSEEHTSELQSLMRISYAVFCLKKKNRHNKPIYTKTLHKTHNKDTY